MAGNPRSNNKLGKLLTSAFSTIPVSHWSCHLLTLNPSQATHFSAEFFLLFLIRAVAPWCWLRFLLPLTPATAAAAVLPALLQSDGPPSNDSPFSPRPLLLSFSSYPHLQYSRVAVGGQGLRASTYELGGNTILCRASTVLFPITLDMTGL